MIISFNPEFKIEDIISPKLDLDVSFMIIGYRICTVDENGFVTSFEYVTSGKQGVVNFLPIEIKESLIHKKK